MRQLTNLTTKGLLYFLSLFLFHKRNHKKSHLEVFVYLAVSIPLWKMLLFWFLVHILWISTFGPQFLPLLHWFFPKTAIHDRTLYTPTAIVVSELVVHAFKLSRCLWSFLICFLRSLSYFSFWVWDSALYTYQNIMIQINILDPRFPQTPPTIHRSS